MQVDRAQIFRNFMDDSTTRVIAAGNQYTSIAVFYYAYVVDFIGILKLGVAIEDETWFPYIENADCVEACGCNQIVREYLRCDYLCLLISVFEEYGTFVCLQVPQTRSSVIRG